jgi:hypothetical protein
MCKEAKKGKFGIEEIICPQLLLNSHMLSFSIITVSRSLLLKAR